MGGSNAPICHGAGITHKTLSDLVREIEYVDVHGEVQTLGDPAMLKAAAGAFGLLGENFRQPEFTPQKSANGTECFSLQESLRM